LSSYPENTTEYIPIYAKTNNQIYIKRPDGTERRLWDVGFGSVIIDENVTILANFNFTGEIYGNGSQLTDIEADNVANNAVSTSAIADGNVTDVKIFNLSWGN